MNKNKIVAVIIIRFQYWLYYVIGILITSLSYCEQLISPGVVVGLPLGAILSPGLLIEDVSIFNSEPNRADSAKNTIGNVDLFVYSTKTRWFDNQFRFLASPAVQWRKAPGIGSSWHYGIPSPLFFGGLVHEIFPGLGIANYAGGGAPLRAGVAVRNFWLFLNLTSLSYTRDDYNITITMIYGYPGNDLTTNNKTNPNFLNFDFTMTKRLSGIEFGPIFYSSKDINVPIGQQQFAVGGLVGFSLFSFGFQFWAGHDVFAYNYPQQATTGYFRIKKSF